MIYVVLEIEDQDFEDVQERLGPRIKGVFRRPTQFCDPANHRGSNKRVTGFTKGRKFGWWVCSICRKPASAWGRSLNAVLGAANNLLKPCGCAEQSAPTDLASELDRDYIAHHTEPCKQCHGTKVTYGV